MPVAHANNRWRRLVLTWLAPAVARTRQRPRTSSSSSIVSIKPRARARTPSSIASNQSSKALGGHSRLLRGILRHGGWSPFQRAIAGIIWVEQPGDYAYPIPTTSATGPNLTGAVKASLRPVGIDYQKSAAARLEQRALHPNQCPGWQPGEPGRRQLSVAAVSTSIIQASICSMASASTWKRILERKSAHGSVCALGVFITRGAANSVLGQVVAATETRRGRILRLPASSSTQGPCFRQDPSYFEYEGSVTTPPCPETVNWVVFRTPIEASPEQIERYGAVFPRTREASDPPLTRRFVLEGGG